MAFRARVQRAALVIIASCAVSAIFTVSASAQNTGTPRSTKRGHPATERGHATNAHGHASKRRRHGKPACGSLTGRQRSKKHLHRTRRCAKPSDTFRLATRRASRTSVSAPQNLSATAGYQKVSLSWGAPSGRTTVAGYWVYRNGVEVAQPTATSYTDTGLTDGDSYRYYVVAHDTSGDASSASNTISATPRDTTPPSTPSNLATSAISVSGAALSWSASTDNVAVAGYNVYLNGTSLGTTALTSYSVTGLSCGTNYTLGVSAYDAAGNSSPTATTALTTIACPAPALPPANNAPPTIAGTAAQGQTLTTATGSWSDGPSSYAYQWQDCNSTGGGCANIGGASSSSYTLAGGDVGDTVRAIVTATNTAGSASADSSATAVITGGGGDGYTGTCTTTISPGVNLATAESGMTAGQTLCLNSGTYGSETTLNVYYQGGTAANPITITSAPGATATIDGNQRIEAPYITEEYLNIDNSNNLATTPQKSGCTNVPYSVALEVDGDGDVLQYDNIYESVAALRANLIGIGFQEEGNGVDYGHPAGVTIRYDKLSDAGGCSQQDHIIYDAEGSGTRIYDNWMWNDPHGWGVQIYPDSSNGQIYSNVIDGAIGGFIDGSGGGNSTYSNVVENSVVEPDDVSGSQYMDVCFGLTAGAASTDSVSGNASYDNANGTGSSCSGITFSNNMTLASSPFVSPSTHNYNLVAGAPVANYGLWNGAGPPTPDPAP